LYGVIEQEFNSARAVIAAQGCHPSDPWGFNAYLLNPSAIEDNDKESHGTAWNSTADALCGESRSKSLRVRGYSKLLERSGLLSRPCKSPGTRMNARFMRRIESNHFLGVCNAGKNDRSTPKQRPAAHSEADLVVCICT
jgi:hypothetical protein